MGNKKTNKDFKISLYMLFIKTLLPIVIFQMIIEIVWIFNKQSFETHQWLKYFKIFDNEYLGIWSIIFWLFICFSFSNCQTYRYKKFKKFIKNEPNNNLNKIYVKWKILSFFIFLPFFSVYSEIYYIKNKKFLI